MTAPPRVAGLCPRIDVFKDAEIVDFAAPYGVFSAARRFDPEVKAFLVAAALRPVPAQARAQAGSPFFPTTPSRRPRDGGIPFSNLNLRSETTFHLSCQ